MGVERIEHMAGSFIKYHHSLGLEGLFMRTGLRENEEAFFC